jgi:hypothetical protein
VDERFEVALTTVLHDLMVTTGLAPRVQEGRWGARPGMETVMLHGPDGSGASVSFVLAKASALSLSELADQVQEWAIEELARIGRSTNWPACPQHRDSHPLEPAVADDRAVWRCPTTRVVVAPIGGLAA